MELVDKLNNKKEALNKVGERSEKILGEYNQIVHVWIKKYFQECGHKLVEVLMLVNQFYKVL